MPTLIRLADGSRSMDLVAKGFFAARSILSSANPQWRQSQSQGLQIVARGPTGYPLAGDGHGRVDLPGYLPQRVVVPALKGRTNIFRPWSQSGSAVTDRITS